MNLPHLQTQNQNRLDAINNHFYKTTVVQNLSTHPSESVIKETYFVHNFTNNFPPQYSRSVRRRDLSIKTPYMIFKQPTLTDSNSDDNFKRIHPVVLKRDNRNLSAFRSYRQSSNRHFALPSHGQNSNHNFAYGLSSNYNFGLGQRSSNRNFAFRSPGQSLPSNQRQQTVPTNNFYGSQNYANANSHAAKINSELSASNVGIENPYMIFKQPTSLHSNRDMSANSEQVPGQMYSAVQTSNDNLYPANDDKMYTKNNDKMYPSIQASNDEMYPANKNLMYPAINDKMYTKNTNKMYPANNNKLYHAINNDMYGARGGSSEGGRLVWLEQPPREVVFSNNTGAAVRCLVESYGGTPSVTWSYQGGRPLHNVSILYSFQQAHIPAEIEIP